MKVFDDTYVTRVTRIQCGFGSFSRLCSRDWDHERTPFLLAHPPRLGAVIRVVMSTGLNWQSPTAAMVRMTLEKRAAVLEAALRRNPSSTRLLTANLHLADQLQEHAVVDSLWSRAIEK